jgi:hyperosmotically inducible protein
MTTRSGFTLIAAAMAASTILLGGCNKPAEPTATTPAVSATSGNVADPDVTTNVRTALLQNATLKGFDINVVTLKGDVRLIGVLDTQAQIDEAIKVARAAEGAHSIHDELVLKK